MDRWSEKSQITWWCSRKNSKFDTLTHIVRTQPVCIYCMIVCMFMQVVTSQQLLLSYTNGFVLDSHSHRDSITMLGMHSSVCFSRSFCEHKLCTNDKKIATTLLETNFRQLPWKKCSEKNISYSTSHAWMCTMRYALISTLMCRCENKIILILP